MVWAVFAVLTALSALAVLVPMARAGRRRDADAATTAPDAAIYADQLAELERDVARGAVAGREAEAARAEIGRRLIRAAQRPGWSPRRGDGASWWRRVSRSSACHSSP